MAGFVVSAPAPRRQVVSANPDRCTPILSSVDLPQQFVSATMHAGFATPTVWTQARRRHGVSSRRNVCMLVSEAHVMMDTMAAQGFPILDSFKGVFIGPTINEIAAAVAGGTVGVMGTLLALETGRQRAMERKQCPYCRGKGRLSCGHCYAIGAMPSVQAVSGQRTCEHCKSGFIECNHCDGEGRLIPIEYERAIRAQYEEYEFGSSLEDYYSDNTPPYL